jgi:hypothetical protein
VVILDTDLKINNLNLKSSRITFHPTKTPISQAFSHGFYPIPPPNKLIAKHPAKTTYVSVYRKSPADLPKKLPINQNTKPFPTQIP